MKKFLGTGLLLVSLLLVLAVQSGYSRPTLGETDVGVVYTISDNNHQISIPAVIESRIEMQIARGVSVPDKGLINDAITYTDIVNFECNIYYSIHQPASNELSQLTGFRNERVKNRFAADLGVRCASSV